MYIYNIIFFQFKIKLILNMKPSSSSSLSLIFTKLEFPICYGDLVLIEDMKFENSNYFLRSNGFISKKIKLFSLNHDPFFEMSSCAFRIYPKTWNINKNKVLDYIQNGSKLNEEEINFKFSREILNNLKIVQNKFSQPIHYGDYVMLMHENTRTFIKFLPHNRKLTLSNHDSDATVFSLEPASEIMYNDNQIIKTGQPVKIKIAWFTYENQGLYFSLRFPYQAKAKDDNDNNNIVNGNSSVNEQINIEALNDDDNNSEKEANIEEHIENELNYFDYKNKLYLKEPELLVEENTNMKWRLTLFSPFTKDENLMIYSDMIHIYHCNLNSILTISEIEEQHQSKLSSKLRNTVSQSRFIKFDLNQIEPTTDSNSSFDLNESDISLINNKSFSEVDNKEFPFTTHPIKVQFYLRQTLAAALNQDVNSIWTIENIFPFMKKQSFVRYFEDSKLDTYRMVFRIKNFKTNKILSICPVANINNNNNANSNIDHLLSEEDMYQKGYLKGSGVNSAKYYKFGLVDEKTLTGKDEDILNEEYQYSLFAFKKMIQSKTFNSNLPEKNDFLRLFHIATQSYLKVIPCDRQHQTHHTSIHSEYGYYNNNNRKVNHMSKCVLTLTKFPEEKDVFKLCPVDPNSQWKFRFLNNLYYLLQVIIHHIDDAFTLANQIDGYKDTDNDDDDDNEDKVQTPKLRFSTLQMMNFILDKLLKFSMNKFINKFSNECGFNNVVKGRQTLISNFGFTHSLLKRFVYNFWLHDDNMHRMCQLNDLLYRISSSEEALNSVNNLTTSEKVLYVMYKYTESIFDFSIVYCKDNELIKAEVYEYLYVYFYFLSIIESCLYGMIEIFKNNQSLLHSLIKDCKQNEKFRKALVSITQTYFPESHLHNDKNLNVIDLIFEYIKISRYVSFPVYNNYTMLHNAQTACHTISLLSRERYFDLLNAMVFVKDGTNILENQRCIIDHIITSKIENEDCLILEDFLENANVSNYAPCLKELLYNMAAQNPDDKIQRFLSMNENLQMNTLLHVHSTHTSNSIAQLAANMKMIIYLIEFNTQKKKITDSDDVMKYEKFISDVKAFFTFQKAKFVKMFIDEYGEWKIDFLNSAHVNLVVAALQFLKEVYENGVVDVKQERTFFVHLMRFLTRNFKMFQQKRFSSLMHGEMSKMQMMLNDRITKTEHSQYISIAESWLKVYQVFRNVLMKLIETEQNNMNINEGNEPSSSATTTTTNYKQGVYYSTLKKTVKTNTMVMKMFMNKHRKSISNNNNNNNDCFTLRNINNINTNDVKDEKDHVINDKSNLKDDNDITSDAVLNGYHVVNAHANTSDKLLKKITHKYVKQTTNVMNLSTNDNKHRSLFNNNNNENDSSSKSIINNSNSHRSLNSNNSSNINDNSKEQLNTDKIESSRDDNASTPINHTPQHEDIFYDQLDLLDHSNSQDNTNNNRYAVNTFDSSALPNNNSTKSNKKQTYLTFQGFHPSDSIFDRANTLNMNDDYNDISKVITSEDEQTTNKNEISKNIINIFKIIIKQNIQTLTNNFYDYYSRLHYNEHKQCKYNFNSFIENCVPNLDSGLTEINVMLRSFCEKKFRSKLPCHRRLSNFNLEFDDKRVKDLNFTQNLIVAFNITDDLSMQEAILSLIYNYFNQRKMFFKNVTLFNEHVITFHRAQTNPFNDKVKIKSDFKRFYQSYEKNKHEYSEDDFNAIEMFFTLLFKQLLTLFRKILNYWKYEFRTLSLENACQYYEQFEENETLIKEIETLISMMNHLETLVINDNTAFTKEFYLSVIEDLMKVFYFVRRNSHNNVFTSLLAILNENGVVFNKMFYSLMNDFIYKGERLSVNFENKVLFFYKKTNTHYASQETLINIKNKFFTCLFLLITLQVVTVPKSDKAIRYLYSILHSQQELMKYDSINAFMILLYISDLQKETLTLNYFAVLEKIKSLNQSECFGDLDTRMHINVTFPRAFTNVYLDIMLNVFKYVIAKGYIINEANLDEMLVENVLFLIKKTEQNVCFTKADVNAELAKSMNNNAYSNNDITKCSLLTKLIRVINFCNEIASLNKIFTIKIDPNIKTNFDNEMNLQYEHTNDTNVDKDMSITNYFPKPHQLYYLLSSSLIYVFDADTAQTKRAVVCIKYVYEIFKYVIFYVRAIDTNYFAEMELYNSDKKEKEQIRELIDVVVSGEKHDSLRVNSLSKECGSDNNNNNNGGSSSNHNNNNIHCYNYYDFLELNDDKSKSLFKAFRYSSFFFLLLSFIHTTVPNMQTFCKLVNIKYEFDSKVIADTSMSSRKRTNDNIMIRSISNYSDDTSNNNNSNDNNNNNNNDDDDDNINSSRDVIMDDDRKMYLSTGKNPYVNYYVCKKLKLIYPDCYYLKEYSSYKRKVRNLSKNKLYLFKKMLYEHKSQLKTLSKNESSSLIYDLLVLLSSETKSQQDQIFYTFMNKIVDFLSRSCTTRLNHKTVKLNNYLLFIVKRILVFYEDNEERLKTSTLRKKSLREMQILVEKTGIIEACLNLCRGFDVPEIKEMLPYIFALFCRILKKGNANSQEAFYSTFTMRNKYELVFSFMLDTVSDKMNYILSNKSKVLKHKKRKISFENKIFFNNNESNLDSKILQFLQLLCENHNRKLQLYLHSQSNFRKSYDLVSHTQHYLTVLFNHFEPFLFEPLVKCFDLLIEFTQGPCLENQLALINSKLLITINDILKFYILCENRELGKHFPKVMLFNNMSTRLTSNNSGTSVEDGDANQVEKNFIKMTTTQISLLAFKSSILLLSLVENRTKDDKIYHTIQSIIKVDVIRQVCCKIYFEYLYMLINADELSDYKLKLNAFGRSNDVEELSKTNVIKSSSHFTKNKTPTDVKDYFILESGFFLYFLSLYYKDYEMNLIKKESTIIKDKGILHALYALFEGTIFFSLSIFIYDSVIGLLKTLTFIISVLMFIITFGRIKVFNLLRIILRHKTYHDDDCWKFYTMYTESIEVLRGDKVYKIYFYLMPFCKKLNKFEKTHFLEGIDRTNSKSKLKDIMKYANEMKYELEKDYVIKECLFYIPIIGVVFKNVELWKDLSLILNIVQNFFNIFAVKKVGEYVTVWFDTVNVVNVGYWRDEKSFFNMTPEDFYEIISALSIAQICLSTVIFVEYILRKVPSVYCIIDEKVISKGYSNTKRRIVFIGSFLSKLCANFELWYYAGYVVFAVLGKYSSDFFNAFLLMEVIQRIKTLRNIFKAIQNSFKKFILVLLFWLVINYIFSLVGYAFFKKEFPYKHDCSTLFKCFATIFYQTIRMDNGIAGYLNTYYGEGRSQNPFIWRFWYDEIANFILKIVVGDILSGIIVDTFLALRMEEMEMRSDMKNICTICSLNRKDISDVYEPRGKTYHDHISEDHKIFNYVFYIIYLYKKDMTEFTGIESYIYDLAVVQKEISWFPLEKLYIANEGDLELMNKDDDDDNDNE